MHRVVVTTPSDELIASVDVAPEHLVALVTSYAAIANTTIYIDGRRLRPEQRMILLQGAEDEAAVAVQRQPPVEKAASVAEAAAAPTMSRPEPTPTPVEVATLADLYRRGFDDLHRGYEEVRRAAAESHRELHGYLKAATEMHITMQRELADEAVRQRRLTAQSLGDIDLMHRAIKTTELNEAFAQFKAANGFGKPGAGAGAQALAKREDRATLGDLYRGVMKMITGGNE